VDIHRDAAKGNTLREFDIYVFLLSYSNGFARLVNAITNYTVRVQDESLSDTQREEALKFLGRLVILTILSVLSHLFRPRMQTSSKPVILTELCPFQFIGDIGQPLHVEAYKKGGNSIPTTCNGKSTELHATWDTGMIEVMLKSTYGSTKDIEPWANDLVEAIQNGIYQSSAAGWISCHSTTKPAPRGLSHIDDLRIVAKNIAPLACPLGWAKESNAYDCVCIFSLYDERLRPETSCSRLYFRTRMVMTSARQIQVITRPQCLSLVSCCSRCCIRR
jgi:S1/P1 Nuclease